MARVLLITNPVAARTDPAVVRTVARVFDREGWEVDVAGTSRAGHAVDLARAGVREGFDAIAVYGGDGTTMQAVNGMIGGAVPLGLIPGGTGNLLAGNLRLPVNAEKAARVIARGRSRAIDVGKVERADGTHYFMVASGAGFDADIMAGTSHAAKRRWKLAAYVAEGWHQLSSVQNVPYRITVDGECLEGTAASILVANCAEFVPPYLRFGRGIALDDGMLEVIILGAEGLFETVDVLWQLVRGKANGNGRVRYARGRVVTVETTPARPVQLDGEAAGETPFTAELLAGAIHVFVDEG